jgi:hypothetical protein
VIAEQDQKAAIRGCSGNEGRSSVIAEQDQKAAIRGCTRNRNKSDIHLALSKTSNYIRSIS